jgi:hypothetical protein
MADIDRELLELFGLTDKIDPLSAPSAPSVPSVPSSPTTPSVTAECNVPGGDDSGDTSDVNVGGGGESKKRSRAPASWSFLKAPSAKESRPRNTRKAFDAPLRQVIMHV